MVKRFSQILAVSFALFVLVPACKKDAGTGNTAATILSPKVSNDLATARSNWNAHAADLVTFVSWTVSGKIGTTDDRDAIISKIMADDAMAAYGNILDAETMHLNSIGELQLQSASTKITMRHYLDEQLNIGDIIVDIAWKNSKASFVSKCIVHNDVIVWDNLLTSTLMMDKAPQVKLTSDETVPTDQSKTTGVYVAWYKETTTWTAGWLWGGHRGEMGEAITIHCQSNGNVYSTDHEDWANMSLGSAKSESKTDVNSGSYGKIQYALGISTPFASLSYNSSTFKVSVSGLGSSMVHNGTHSLTPWLL